jgi:hypothetical protein
LTDDGNGVITARDLYAGRRGFIVANELKFSIDDTTLVLGLEKKDEQMCLYERGTDGNHTAISKRPGAKPCMDIMRDSMTVAFNGVGRSAVPFVAVQVSEKELTNQSGEGHGRVTAFGALPATIDAWVRRGARLPFRPLVPGCCWCCLAATFYSLRDVPL